MKKKLLIGGAVVLIILVAYFMFFYNKKNASGEDHPTMKNWADRKKSFFRDWVFQAATRYKLEQANAGKWPEIFVQADEWGLDLNAAIAKHNEWEYDNGYMISAYIDTEWWKGAWEAHRMQNGLDINGNEL